jgi:hypothetical protein
VRRAISSVLPVATALLFVMAGVADGAETPWFRLTASSRPSQLAQSEGRADVQELTIAEPNSGFCLGPHTEAPGGEVACFEDGASAATVESSLQTTVFPSRALTVKRESIAGASVYRVTFPGQDVRTMGTAPTAEELEAGGTSLTQVVRGEAAGQLALTAANVGDGNANGEGSPLVIADVLPQGLKAVSMEALAGGQGSRNLGPVNCTLATVSCSFSGTVPPYNQIEVRIGVIVEKTATTGQTAVKVSGAGARPEELRRPITISSEPAVFGAQDYELAVEEEGGAAGSQAGSHPFQLTTTLTMDQGATKLTPTEIFEVEPVELPKTLSFNLPPGLVGNPTALPKCTLAQFSANKCATNTVLGVAIATYNEPRVIGVNMKTVPLYNLEPAKGEPARFGFLPTNETPVLLDTSVRTGGDYGVTVSVSNILQTIGLISSTVTLWGVPGDSRHDLQRGEGCLAVARGRGGSCTPANESQPPPFLTLPTSCTGEPLQSTVDANSWNQPQQIVSVLPERALPALDGCERLPFAPQVKFAPLQSTTSTASGFELDVHVPQGAERNATGVSPADVRDLSFLLPEGVVLNPASASGLQSCTLAEIALNSPAAPSCPDGSRIGNVTIHTPLLSNPLTGHLYLASPQNFAGAPLENPFGTLVSAYLVISDPQSGVLVKLASRVALGESGRVTATVEDSPQLPFEDAELEFFGGDGAPLATPAHCGSYQTVGILTPWSGSPAAESASHFELSSGPRSGACPGAALPLAPSFHAGVGVVNAGAFAPLTTTIGRESGNESLKAVRLHFPTGLSGVLTGVALCPEAAANAGSCSAASQVGEAVTSVGFGNSPYVVTGGKVYLTEKYEGAPFGLSIVTPAKAGPFDLQEGRPVVVRAQVQIDRNSAALTIATDSIPRVIDGVPLEIRNINVVANRPGFTFNPTSCGPKVITGEVEGWEGATAAVSDPFAVANCAKLKFGPKITAVTSAKTSRANGTSLTVKLTYPKSVMGTEANIAKVKVVLPKQLPSRVSTLNKACLAVVFAANPGNCSPDSVVGQAEVTTPVIPVPLRGKAYFVSHGGAAFPSLTMVLQGYGITIELVGDTLIRKGITSTTFRSVPDVPFSQFSLTLPKGRFSALGGFGNLCKAKLKMPTAFVAQNGAEIHESNTIAVTGCAKHKATKKKKKKK